MEFRVGKDYCVRPPQEPIYIFAIDVSPSAIASGMMRGAIDAISQCLDHLPGGDGGETGEPGQPWKDMSLFGEGRLG